VQHGEPVSKEVDPERPLSEKGKQDAKKIAEFLKASGIKIDIILSSTKKRAIETAEIFADRLLPKQGRQQREGLAPNDPVDKLYNEIERDMKKETMIVGHLPFLQKFSSMAITGKESNILVDFCQAGVVCLERESPGLWQLIFAVTPDLL
jgi:phosphohistidine phosphatase